MDAERARGMLLALPNVAETMQWGDNLVFWVGDKAIGGKMFALLNLDGRGPVASFAAGAERAAELVEVEGFRPAPYFARLHWIAAERWDVVPAREWEQLFAAAHAITYDKLAPRTKLALALPPNQRTALIAQRRKQTEGDSSAGGRKKKPQ